MGLECVQITPREDNVGAIKTIIKNGGVLLEKFYDGDIKCLRYEIFT